jgi:hypothetical protein
MVASTPPALPQGLVLTGKAYVVAIPIAALDRTGQPLEDDRVREWTRRTLRELTDCFGGATLLPAPGSSVVVNGRSERGQAVAVAACDRREAYLDKRERLRAFAAALKDGLDQETVLVLAFASDSFLVEERL